MSPMNVLYAGLNFTYAPSFAEGLSEFAAERSLAWKLADNANGVLEWLKQPCMP